MDPSTVNRRARQLFTSKCFGASAYVNFKRKASATRTLMWESSQWWVGRFWSRSIKPWGEDKIRLRFGAEVRFNLPESPSPAVAARASGAKRRHKRTAETRQSHRTRPDMCPTTESYSRVEVHVSASCSSIGTRTGDNRRHAIGGVCGVSLKVERLMTCDQCETLRQLTVNPLNQFLKLVDLLLNAKLREYVIILNAVEELADAPERIGLDEVALQFRQLL